MECKNIKAHRGNSERAYQLWPRPTSCPCIEVRNLPYSILLDDVFDGTGTPATFQDFQFKISAQFATLQTSNY